MKIKGARPGVRTEYDLGPWDGGIDEKTEPGALGANFLHAAENVLLDEVPGVVTKCWGSKKVAEMPTGVPARFAYEYKKNDGSTYFLVSDGAELYATKDMVAFGTALITGLDETAYLQFETIDDKCWIMNGSDFTMWFDGTDFEVMDREYGNATPAVTDAGTSSTQIIDAALPNDPITPASTAYWVNRRVVIVSGTYAGMEGLVTAFNPATHKLTIEGFDNDPGSGVSYMVGLIMVKGAVLRARGIELFVGCTSENGSEVRFNRTDDPDTGIRMHVDNPRAWPANYQIVITQNDGDKVYSFSPVYRDRVLVTKGTAIYRLEADSTRIYVPVLVSQEVGCRYPDSWVVKGELLHFLGSERSGLLDMYVTDMVSVKPLHKDGNLVPSFQNMFKSEKNYKYRSRASTDDFNTGDVSTFCETKNGKLECRTVATKSDWDDVMVAAENVSARASVETDSVVLDGIPAWPQKYECNELPTAASPVWTKYATGEKTESIVAGKLLTAVGGIGAGRLHYFRNNVFSSIKNTYACFRAKGVVSGNITGSIDFIVQNGSKQIKAQLMFGLRLMRLYVNSVNQGDVDFSDYKTVNVLLDKNGKGMVYVDGVKLWSGDAIAAAENTTEGYTNNAIVYAATAFGATNLYLDFIYEDADFDLLTTEMPATLPTTGTVVVKLDYTRAPESYGAVWLGMGHDYTGTVGVVIDPTHFTDTSLPGEDDFWLGRLGTALTGATAGRSQLVAAFNATTKIITIAGSGSFTPVQGDTYQINRGGSFTIQTQSSDDDITYSALASLYNGQIPGTANATPKKRYLKLVITMTRQDCANGPELVSLICGFLWRMKAIQVGSNITAWRNFISDTTTPSGAQLEMRIRLATTIATPLEADFGTWRPITNSNDIGTILSDTPPPKAGEGRWLDVKVEGGIGALALSGYLENFSLNWQEGGAVGANLGLVVAAFMYKKRLYLTGMSAVATANDSLFVLDTRKAWTKFTGQNINRLISFNGQIYGLSSLDENIKQMEVEGSYSNDAAPIVGFIEPGAMDFGHQRVELQAVKVGSVGINSTVEVLTSYEGDTWVSLGTLVFTGDGTKILRVARGRIGKQHFFRLKGSAAEGLAINLFKVAVVALPEER